MFIPVLSRRKGKPFSMNKVSGLVYHYDASDASKFTLVSGKASVFNASSGISHSNTQGTDAERPTRVENVQGGKAILRFNDTTNTSMAGSGTITVSGVFTYYIVFNTTQNDGSLVMNGVVDQATRIGSGGQYNFRSGGANNLFTVAQAIIGTFRLYKVTRDGSDNIRVFQDGVESSTGAIVEGTDFGLDDFGSWQGAVGSSDEFDGDFGEVGCYSKILTATEDTIISNGLNAKWGLG